MHQQFLEESQLTFTSVSIPLPGDQACHVVVKNLFSILYIVRLISINIINACTS